MVQKRQEFIAIRPEMKSTERNKRKCPLSAIGKRQCISSYNCVDKTNSSKISKFSVLLNHQYRILITFSGIIVFSRIRCYWNFKIVYANRKCAKTVEIFVCQKGRTCSVGYDLVVNVQKDACFGLSRLTALYDFKICGQILEIAIFEKILEIPFPQKCQLF